MKIYETLNKAADYIIKGRHLKKDVAKFEAAELLMFLTGFDKPSLYAKFQDNLPGMAAKKLFKLTHKRAAGMPLQYLTGTAHFYGNEFICKKGVLIPRQDTEAVIEAVKSLPLKPKTQAAELGPGSGIISVTLCLECPEIAHITAIDISKKAISLTYLNAKKHGVEGRITAKYGNFFTLSGKSPSKFDIIVSNPPYITKKAMSKLQKEVLHEPSTALTDKKDGLSFYKRLASEAKNILTPGGYMVLEIGDGMESKVRKVFHKENWKYLSTFNDFKGLKRVVIFLFIGQKNVKQKQ
ncbi:MAG TPA: peptide chain release factor N(5)-glutamine methyltransferase [Candidatus Goldiibacteriota bacterium]|nr:peptide chain release factor N(5)-glutamine methyltransferase [Candidatus Goldiibacteriota bacterium]HPN64314.1 peptide chain release factor N(5)-glutamine methyltransferase [Candidatus Goldiibacteriota bacterium]HRQ44520.1 peptide chain release factor N(5)-glutamine methyltransferase [Candidatus Goldiibacteriota bacterium]